MHIAVIGATGLLGKPVTQELIAAGFNVTILARHPEAAKSLFPGVRVVQADLRDEASLAAGLRGQQAVYLNLSVLPEEKESDFHTEAEGLDHLLSAAKTAGIQRIGYLSSVVMRYQGMNGFRWWVFGVKQEAVRKIKASGIPYLLFYPSTFMESFYLQMQGSRLTMAGKSAVKLGFIAAADYGKQVARAFRLPATTSAEYVVQGPQQLSYADAARTFVENYAKQKLTIANAPLGLLKFIGFFSRKIDYVAHILEALNGYPETFEAQRTWADLGKPSTTVAEFAKSNVE